MEICNDCDWGIKYLENFAIMLVNGVGYRFFMFDMTKEGVIEFIKYFKPNNDFETIDINKTSLSRKYIICHYWYFRDLEFYVKPNICDYY